MCRIQPGRRCECSTSSTLVLPFCVSVDNNHAFCGQCGVALDRTAKFCPRCGAARRKRASALTWALGCIVATLLVLAICAGFSALTVRPTPTPVPLTESEKYLVQSYYSRLSQHHFVAAYQLFSPGLRHGHSLKSYAESYGPMTSVHTSGMTASEGAVSFALERTDRTDDGPIQSTYQETWHIIHGSNGALMLDNLDSSLLYTSYFMSLSRASLADVYRKLKWSIGIVIAREPSRVEFGSAFCIGSDSTYSYFLTNNHVVPDGTDVKILPMFGPEENPVDATVIARDSDYDAAIIRTAVADVPIVRLAIQPPAVGKSAAVAGFPDVQIQLALSGMGLSPSTHVGTVNAITDDGSLIEFDATVDHGNSGGPLYDPNTGLVYGMVTYGLQSQQSTAVQNNFALSMQALWPFIKDSKIRVLDDTENGGF